ncbi:MAG: hypothetical protein HC841_02870 [Verrucomicrobiae bacterium]|nr:hypothetical protein [Verrucomicrobiae bacterium]
MLVVVTAVGAAILPSIQRTAVYNPEQTRGFVRIVLLKVERSTVFSDRGFAETSQKEIHAIPGFGFTYMVEALGSDPADNWHVGVNDDTVTANGQKLSQFKPENLAGGGLSSTHEYRNFDWAMLRQPEVTDPKRAKIIREWIRGMKSATGKLDLKIVAGFGKHKETFEFKGIPVD